MLDLDDPRPRRKACDWSRSALFAHIECGELRADGLKNELSPRCFFTSILLEPAYPTEERQKATKPIVAAPVVFPHMSLANANKAAATENYFREGVEAERQGELQMAVM